MSAPPQLLPGEKTEHYQAVQAVIFRDLAPLSAVEWLLAIDIAELPWEIQRYRILRHRPLSMSRQKAIETTLRRIDVSDKSPSVQSIAEFYIVRNALEWQLDPNAAAEIDARLEDHGFDQHAVSMEAYVQAREVLPLLEGLLNGAQLRRVSLLKELTTFRETRLRASGGAWLRTARKIVPGTHQGT
ncbi:hypothetical protein [Bradyrhizobium sp. WYCCWR 12699]|uniref:hypothetical protein n=1 Tax=Bradyrhizobium sp. WYCCWR 12699 TaxID=3064203 RepID=UPI0028A48985|nr:hypothetical protein [Bradyrhizobium sp. WYCCWR 12699]MDT4740724.1 hypothetical protein [Bradyrhizobium sp. WYCCWR 12699]